MASKDDQSIPSRIRPVSTSVQAKSRSLPAKSKPPRRLKQERVSAIEATSSETKSDNERLHRILDRLEIRFKNCTFTYKPGHLSLASKNDPMKGNKKPRRSMFSRMTKRITNTLESVSNSMINALDCNTQFEHCLFVPTTAEDTIKEFIRNQFPSSKISFYNCKFLQRGSTVLEQMARKLRKFVGIIFELDYITSQATIEECIFRVKDIFFVSSYVQERIAEKA